MNYGDGLVYALIGLMGCMFIFAFAFCVVVGLVNFSRKKKSEKGKK